MKRLRAGIGIAAVLLLTGCNAAVGQPSSGGQGSGTGHGLDRSTSTVTGRLLREGGPLGPGGAQPAVRMLTGTVQFAAERGRPIVVQVGKSGRFSVQLPTGTYNVVGRSPQIMEVSADGAQHETPCSVPTHVTVTAPRPAKVNVICVVP
jgi:hypothetical protein